MGKAEARLIYQTISSSERLAGLGIKGALLFTWLLTHCDCQGRMPAKPTIVKYQVVPFLDEISIDDIAEALQQMAYQKLVILYEDDKERSLLQVADWWEYQTGLHYLSASHYDPPRGWKDKLTPRDENGKFTKTSEGGLVRNGTVNGTRRETKRNDMELKRKDIEEERPF